MKSNLNAIMQELQSIKQQMNFSNAHEISVHNRQASPLIQLCCNLQQRTTPPPPQTQHPYAPSFPPQHMPAGTKPEMHQSPTPQWIQPPPGFHRENHTHGSCGFGFWNDTEI